MSSPAVTADQLLAAAAAGDELGLAEAIVEMTEKDRRSAAAVVSTTADAHRWPRDDPVEERRRAFALAVLGTATAREFLGSFWTVLVDTWTGEAVARVFRARGDQFTEAFVRGALKPDGARHWRLLRTLVREGVVDQPTDPAYTLGMVMRVGISRGTASWFPDAVYDGLIRDPDLLVEDVWTIFAVDAGQELMNSRAMELDESGRRLVSTDENRWICALTQLAGEGRLDRGRLLNESLAAQMRDFRASSVIWYARMHEALAPTNEERLARLPTYLTLLASPTPTVVKSALDAVKVVEQEIPPEELARALTGALSHRQKNLAVESLRLLDRAAQRSERARPALVGAALEGLAHERADVQKQAMDVLERWQEVALDPTCRARMLELADQVAPSLRERVSRLTGLAIPAVELAEGQLSTIDELDRAIAELGPVARAAAGVDQAIDAIRAGRWPAPAEPRMTPELLRLVRLPLEPISTVNELIEVAAALLEGQGGGNDVERLFDGLSRLGAERSAGFERRTGGLTKRAAQVLNSDYYFGFPGTALVARVVLAWTVREDPAPRGSGLADGVGGFLGARTLELVELLVRGRSRSLLALPTHSGGWIDPDVLRARQRSVGRLRGRPLASDLIQARARAFPALGKTTVIPATDLPKMARVAVALGDAPAVLGRLGNSLEVLGRGSGFGFPSRFWSGSDWLGARWSQTIIPSLPEAPFAAAYIAATQFIDNPIAWGRPEAMIERALDPDERLPKMGWWCIAASVLSKSPDLQRAGSDALVTSTDDGRFDPTELGQALAWLLESGFGKAGRLDRPLRDLGRISDLHAAQVVRLVVVLSAFLRASPTGIHVPLEIAAECALSSGVDVEDAHRPGLEALAARSSPSSKVSRAAKALLGTEGDGKRAARLKLAFAQKSMERAQRYARLG